MKSNLFNFRHGPNEFSPTTRSLCGSTAVVDTTLRGRSTTSPSFRKGLGVGLFILFGLFGVNQTAWAFTTDGSTYVEFVNGDVITFDFSAVTCTDAGVDRVGISLQKIGSSPYQSATLTFTGTKRCTTSQDRLQVHWKDNNNWSHGGTEWTEIGSTNFPFPTSSSQTTIKVTLDGNGKTLYTWSAGGGGGGDKCKNCGTVNK